MNLRESLRNALTEAGKTGELADRIQSEFWPNSSPQAARSRLSHALSDHHANSFDVNWIPLAVDPGTYYLLVALVYLIYSAARGKEI